MFLDTKDGIICDFCGTIYRDRFVYYSVNDSKRTIANNFLTSAQQGEMNADMCTHCYEKLLNDVRKYLGPVKKGKIKCDLSKQYKNGTFTYHWMVFDKVDIDKSRADEVKIDKKVMDLTLIDAYNKLLEQVKVTREKIKKEGVWS
jgi:hypothetical protein